MTSIVHQKSASEKPNRINAACHDADISSFARPLDGVALFSSLETVSMAKRVIQTSRRLAVERQIHAAIAHFRAGDFECAISLCSAAEGQMPEPNQSTHLFGILRRAAAERPAPDGPKDDFNYVANWMKHVIGADEVKIEDWVVTMWLNRAISKYRAVYGIGTPEMIALFPWAGQTSAPRS